jgi:hypothetical protein
MPFIEKEFPHLAKRYWATYAFDHKVSATYAERLRTTMRALCDRYGIAYGYYGGVDEAEAIEEKFAGAEQLELSFEETALLGTQDGMAQE